MLLSLSLLFYRPRGNCKKLQVYAVTAHGYVIDMVHQSVSQLPQTHGHDTTRARIPVLGEYGPSGPQSTVIHTYAHAVRVSVCPGVGSKRRGSVLKQSRSSRASGGGGGDAAGTSPVISDGHVDKTFGDCGSSSRWTPTVEQRTVDRSTPCMQHDP